MIKRFISIIAAFALVMTMLTACGNTDTPEDSDTPSTSKEPQATETLTPGESQAPSGTPTQTATPPETATQTPGISATPTETATQTPEPSETPAPEKNPEIYDLTEGRGVEIGEFINGKAPFVYYVTVSYGPPDYRAYYGVIDIKGNVVIGPIEVMQTPAIGWYLDFFDSLKYNYVTVTDSDDVCYLYDLNGNLICKSGTDNISAIGGLPAVEGTQRGYYWIETYEEKLSGNVYTVTYYSAVTGEVVATFEGCCTIPDDLVYDYGESSISADGVGILFNMETLSFFEFNMADYDPNFVKVPDRDTEAGEDYIFSHNLCPAYDSLCGLWGYIDVNGNWKIIPKYKSAESFSVDGYAFVNDNIVIDTNGNIVLCPLGWENGNAITDISGVFEATSFRYQGNEVQAEFGKDKVVFTVRGSIICTENYSISDNTITFENIVEILSQYEPCEGTYTFSYDGYCLRFNGMDWYRIE